MLGIRARALPPRVHAVNESLALIIELAMLAALAWWGATVHGAIATRVLLAVAAPLAAGVVWGLFAAPRARIRMPVLGVLAVKAVVFGLTALAAYAAGLQVVAVVVGVLAFLSACLAAVDREAIGGGGRMPRGARSTADVVDDRDHVGQRGAEHRQPGQ
jgi:hypothetical protein